MPVIIGTTTDETASWANTAGVVTDLASYMAAIDSVFGAASREAILRQYPVSAYPDPSRAFVRLTTDALFTCRNRRAAETLAAAQPQPVYRYLFGYVRQNNPNGAGHSAEVQFLYGRGSDRPTESDLAMQRMMMDYWTRMARTANPNGAGDPLWSPHRAGNDSYLQIGETTQTRTGPSAAKCDFWDTVQLPWPHL
jgi:para-nitrobenzyl esterase